jgi:hypothetical protein
MCDGLRVCFASSRRQPVASVPSGAWARDRGSLSPHWPQRRSHLGRRTVGSLLTVVISSRRCRPASRSSRRTLGWGRRTAGTGTSPCPARSLSSCSPCLPAPTRLGSISSPLASLGAVPKRSTDAETSAVSPTRPSRFATRGPGRGRVWRRAWVSAAPRQPIGARPLLSPCTSSCPSPCCSSCRSAVRSLKAWQARQRRRGAGSSRIARADISNGIGIDLGAR